MNDPSELGTLRRLVADVAKAYKRAPYEVIIELGFELLDPLELPDPTEWAQKHGV